MTNKHTPAPWSINEWPQKDTSIRVGAIGTPVIASIELRDVSVNEQKANAHLIAAAPELFEIIGAMSDCMDKGISCHFQTGCAMHLKMREAINKAKGL